MALWDVDGEIVYTEGSLSLTPEKANALFVTRHRYKIPYSNVGMGGFVKTDRGTFHTPSWIEVHPQASFEDLIVDKKPFEELSLLIDTESQVQNYIHKDPELKEIVKNTSDFLT